jgi:hypothetical protein
VCRRRNQVVKVVVGQPQDVAVEKREVSENFIMNLGWECLKGEKTG